MSKFSMAVMALVSCVGTQAAVAQTTVRIEEDWELVVTQPVEALDAPQVTVTMVPFGSDSGLLLQVDLNHASTPVFAQGGFQVRVCTEETCLGQVRFFDDQRLHHDAEVVTWTQAVQLTPHGFSFGVSNGSSWSWGSFGGSGAAVNLNHGGGSLSLNAYNPQLSIANSGVTYAGNRVEHLRLKRIRATNSAGEVTEWTINQDVQL